ncbi:uncharacterized protein [Nicotiana sylvestris]|uniref:Uncharacterized protein LOC104223793 n=1 Tax=Nicotiana sylvestris TaxID=4096 RepID=A0A1U7WG37_NICSY|nr:PREDICTED: uncharacterized protein LOC104223793 [Nicotiana sylvestris]
MLSGFAFVFAPKKRKGTLLATVACLWQKESNGYSSLKAYIIFSISFLKTDQEMDKRENKIQLLGIFNEFLCYIMSFGCPVCYSLSICRWLFNLFKDTTAGHVNMITSLDYSWRNGFLIINRLFEFVVQSLAAEAIKPVTLGDSMNYSLVKTSQSRAKPGNRNSSSNEQILHSEDSTSDVLPKLEETAVEDDSVLKNGENDLSQLTNEENEGDVIVEEEAPRPSMETQNKAPKKMVSINDNVEEIYFSKKKKMKKKKSTENVPSIKEQEKEEPKPLKSILKVGSNINDNWDQNK